MEDKSGARRTLSAKDIVRLVLIVILIGFGMNLLIAFLMDGKLILESLAKVNFLYIIIPFLCYFAIYLIDTLRLKLVLSQFSYKIRLSQGFHNSALGSFLTNLTPMAAGGQPFQIYHLQTLSVDGKTATNIILSRFVETAMTSIVMLLASTAIVFRIIRSIYGGGSIVMYAGFSVTIIFAVVFLLMLIRPDYLGKLAVAVENTRFGRFIAKISKTHDWGLRVHAWSKDLKEDVRFLWTEKLYIMIVDILLGFGNILLQGFSLYFVLTSILHMKLSYLDVLLSFVAVSQVVFYIPTPGASGSVEGAFAMVFSGLTQQPETTLVAIFLWRFATYYCHIFFGVFLFSWYMRKRKQPG